MSSSPLAVFFAQATNAAVSAAGTTDATAPTPPTPPWWTNLFFPALIMAMVYLSLIHI